MQVSGATAPVQYTDTNGNPVTVTVALPLPVTGSGSGGTTVNQGTAGVDPWLVTPQQYAFQFDGSASPVLYLGEATIGSATSAAVWRIQKINTASGVQITWANGAGTFANAWTNRASLSYS